MLEKSKNKRIIRILLTAVLTICLVVPAALPVRASSPSQATGKIKAKGGAVLRATPSSKGKKIKVLKNKTKVVITEEVFASKKSTSKKKRWYAVKASGKTGYVRADLVNSIKYSAGSKITTDSLNYRTGPSTKFKKKGSFKKGAAVSVVLKARIRGESYPWYRVKKGKSYYYASAQYMTDKKPAPKPAPKPAATTSTAATKPKTTSSSSSSVPASQVSSTQANKEVTTAVIEIRKDDVTVDGTDIKVDGLRYPVTLAEGGAFSVMGTVTSSLPIDSVTVGVVNSSGNWVISNSAEAGETTFDIYTLDANLKFGGIPQGSYTYKVIIRVDGNEYIAGSYPFKVVKLKGPSAIASTAIALAWPEGTSESTYKKSATNAEKAAAKLVGYSSAADCGNFATIVLRKALGNYSIPNFLNAALNTKGNLAQMQSTAQRYGFSAFNWNGSMSSLRAGDVLIYKKNGDTSSGSGQHIFIYLGNNKVAEANHPKHYYGNIDTKSPGKGVLSLSDRKFYYVLRCYY